MLRLLIVDDEPDERDQIREAALQAGFSESMLTCPETWDQALDVLAAGESFRVAVVDIVLWTRWEGGVDYIRELRRLQPDCWIIAITMRRGNDALIRAMRAGANSILNLRDILNLEDIFDLRSEPSYHDALVQKLKEWSTGKSIA
jgi:DNA-binding response OmpR family regulator